MIDDDGFLIMKPAGWAKRANFHDTVHIKAYLLLTVSMIKF